MNIFEERTVFRCQRCDATGVYISKAEVLRLHAIGQSRRASTGKLLENWHNGYHPDRLATKLPACDKCGGRMCVQRAGRKIRTAPEILVLIITPGSTALPANALDIRPFTDGIDGSTQYVLAGVRYIDVATRKEGHVLASGETGVLNLDEIPALMVR
jgi:hypothetical protein